MKDYIPPKEKDRATRLRQLEDRIAMVQPLANNGDAVAKRFIWKAKNELRKLRSAS